MQLTLPEFLNRFPAIRGTVLARQSGLTYRCVSDAKQGYSLTQRELSALNSAVKRLAADLQEIEITSHLDNGLRRTKLKP